VEEQTRLHGGRGKGNQETTRAEGTARLGPFSTQIIESDSVSANEGKLMGGGETTGEGGRTAADET